MRSKRPLGQPTRGKTALNRLRQVDTYILLAWESVLRGVSPLIIDLGYGAYPWTALEMHSRWQPINPNLRLLGVEIDAERVANALPYAEPGIIDFKQGGFNLIDLLGKERAQVIRAFNVLRQYEESAVADALYTMGQALAPGRILIEGTSTPSGRLVTFDIYQETEGFQHQALVFGTNFREPITLAHFQAILPKRLIHHTYDEPLFSFFAAWDKALLLARGRGFLHPRQQWIAAALILRHQFGYPIDTRKRLLKRGFLVIMSGI